MELVEFGPDSAADVRRYTGLLSAADAVDAAWLPPRTERQTETEMRYGWDGEPGRYFLAQVDGEVVGAVKLDASEYDNLDLVWFEPVVRPDHRRRGHGTRLVAAAVEEIRAAGRHLAGTNGWDSPGVRAFAESVGFPLKAQEIARRLALPVDPDLLKELHEEAASAAQDYELLRIEGATPDDLVGAVAELTGAINDAPMDDLEYEDEVYPPERIRAYEEAARARGARMYRVVARHRPSGELAGHTVMQVYADVPDHADQHDTSVSAGHRGHRLGLLLKTEMLGWLAGAEPQLRTADTWNAESNAHMIGVNERLGHTVMDRMLSFQRRV